MADQYVPLIVKTKALGDVGAKIVDSGGTNVAAVDASGRVSVSLAASSATVTVETELPTAAALADATANPSVPTVGAAGLLYNGTTWDRVRGDTTNGLDVDVTRVQGTVAVDSELPAAAALADNTANPTVPGVGAFLMGFDGTNWDRIQTGGAASGALKVDGSAVTQPVSIAGTQSVDVDAWNGVAPTAAAALADSMATPTAPQIGAFLMAWDDAGGNWDRVRINASSELVVTTSASSGAPTDPRKNRVTSSGLATGGTVDLDSTQISSSKTGKLANVVVCSANPLRIDVKTVLNGTPTTIMTAFTSAANPTFDWTPPHANYVQQAENVGGGLDGFRVTVTNRDDVLTADVYATFYWDEV
jgi:hypothetical protein